MGYQSIRCGDANIVVAGGQESMSQSVHAMHMRNGIKFGNGELKDTMIVDGLTDAFSNIHMGITGNPPIFVRKLHILPKNLPNLIINIYNHFYLKALDSHFFFSRKYCETISSQSIYPRCICL